MRFPQIWPEHPIRTHRYTPEHASLDMMLHKQALRQLDLFETAIPPALKKAPAFPEGKAGRKYPQQWTPEASEKETTGPESCGCWDTCCGSQAYYHRVAQSSRTDLPLAPFGGPGRGGLAA